MLSSRVVIHFAIVCFINPNYGLQRSQEISATTDAIRHVVNDIFSSLRVKMNKTNEIKKYAAIHKHFVKLTWQENDNWNEVLKSSRHDIKIDNGSADFMTVINELLNDENKVETTSDLLNEDNANICIEYFLNTLKKLKENYLFNNSDSTENNEVLQLYYRDRNNTEDNAKASSENGANDCDVWVPSEARRIFHRERTKIQDHPFVVSVHLFNAFACAGSIISADLVITAASCLQLLHNNRFFRENPLSLTVRMGSSYYDVGGEVIPAVEVYFHPSYDPPTLRNNLAIMRLRRSIRFSKKERKIKRIEIDRNNWALPPNIASITLLGWGVKNTFNEGKVSGPGKLSEVQLDYFPMYECQEIYPELQVMDKSFCAGFFAQGGGACNRDLGAPAVVHGQLVGVVSFGAAFCGVNAKPTVFTKVGFYADWIESIMEQTPTIYTAEPTTRRRPYFYQTTEAAMGLADNSFTIQPILPSTTDSSRETNLRTIYDKEFKEFLRNKRLSVNSTAQQTTVKKQVKYKNKKHAQKKITENTKSLEDADRVTHGSRSSTDTNFAPDLDIEELYGLSSPDKEFAKERDKVTMGISGLVPHMNVKLLFDDKEGASNETDREQAVVNSKIRSKPKLNQNTITGKYSVLLKKMLNSKSEDQTISSNSLEVEQNTLPEPDLNDLQAILLALDQPSIEDFETSQRFEQKKLQKSGDFEPKKQHSPGGFYPERPNSTEGFDERAQYIPKGFDPQTPHIPAGFEINEPNNFKGFDVNKQRSFRGFNTKTQHSLKDFEPNGPNQTKPNSEGYELTKPQNFETLEPNKQQNSNDYKSNKQLSSNARNEFIRPPRIIIDGIGLPIRKAVETSKVRQVDHQIDQIIEYINVDKVVNAKVPKQTQGTDIAVDTKIQENLKHQEEKESRPRNNDILSQLYMPRNTKIL